jgi:hypothetical protein
LIATIAAVASLSCCRSAEHLGELRLPRPDHYSIILFSRSTHDAAQQYKATAHKTP